MLTWKVIKRTHLHSSILKNLSNRNATFVQVCSVGHVVMAQKAKMTWKFIIRGMVKQVEVHLRKTMQPWKRVRQSVQLQWVIYYSRRIWPQGIWTLCIKESLPSFEAWLGGRIHFSTLEAANASNFNSGSTLAIRVLWHSCFHTQPSKRVWEPPWCPLEKFLFCWYQSVDIYCLQLRTLLIKILRVGLVF